ncbi:hypothetical protein B9Z55_018012 [Caenorhabditis nigoni]|uniref:Serpentine receptor class gamma n=1 Tax=Caenorhabditis nigoni TaxID=1611254 RepID=A0A2G5TC66_9PELO|nr:hypothetical protein B9Z55_018012 [Caenorhabditis nigoni]
MENFTVFMENVTVDSTTEILTYIQLSYGVPSFIQMVLYFFIILFGKKYKKSSFYRLVLFDLCTNIFVYANTWIAIRLEMHPSMIFILKAVEYYIPGLLTALKYFPYWFFHMHFWTAALLTIHRMTSIAFPYAYENFWNRYFWGVVLLCCVYSHAPKYLWTAWLYQVNIWNGQLVCVNFPGTLKAAINVVAAFSVTYFCLNLALGLSCARMASRKIEATSSKSNIKKKLNRIALTYSVVYTAEVIWSVLNAANGFWNFLPAFFVKLNTNLLVFASDLNFRKLKMSNVSNILNMEAVKADSTVETLTTIQLSYGLPSLMLMISFLVLMGCSKMYSNSFYRLVQLDLLTNILLYFNTWLGIRVEMHPAAVPFLKFIEATIPGLLNWFKYLTWWFMHIQFLCAAILNVHRISSIFFPSKYEKFWTRYYALFGFSFFIYSFLPTLFWFGFANEVSIINGTLSKKRNTETIVKATNVTAVFSVIYFVVILVLGLSTSILVKSKVKAIGSASHENIGRKLTRIALTYCFVYTGILMWSVITALNSKLNFLPTFIVGINQNLLVFSSDLMTLSLPYILMIFDTNVRKHVFQRTTPVTSNNFGFTSFQRSS